MPIKAAFGQWQQFLEKAKNHNSVADQPSEHGIVSMGEAFLSPSCLLYMVRLHFHIMSRKDKEQGRCLVMEGRFRFGCTPSACTPTLFSPRHFITAMAEDEFTAEFFQATGSNLNVTQHPIATAALSLQEQDDCLYHGRQLYILQGPLQTQVFC